MCIMDRNTQSWQLDWLQLSPVSASPNSQNKQDVIFFIISDMAQQVKKDLKAVICQSLPMISSFCYITLRITFNWICQLATCYAVKVTKSNTSGSQKASINRPLKEPEVPSPSYPTVKRVIVCTHIHTHLSTHSFATPPPPLTGLRQSVTILYQVFPFRLLFIKGMDTQTHTQTPLYFYLCEDFYRFNTLHSYLP